MFSWLRAPPIANDNYFSSSSLTKKNRASVFSIQINNLSYCLETMNYTYKISRWETAVKANFKIL